MVNIFLFVISWKITAWYFLQHNFVLNLIDHRLHLSGFNFPVANFVFVCLLNFVLNIIDHRLHLSGFNFPVANFVFVCLGRLTSALSYYGIVLLSTEMFQTNIDSCHPHGKTLQCFSTYIIHEYTILGCRPIGPVLLSYIR